MRLQDQAALRVEVKRALRRQYREIKLNVHRCKHAQMNWVNNELLPQEETLLTGLYNHAYHYQELVENSNDENRIEREDTVNAILELIEWVKSDGIMLYNIWNIQNGTYVKQTYQEHLQEITA